MMAVELLKTVLTLDTGQYDQSMEKAKGSALEMVKSLGTKIGVAAALITVGKYLVETAKENYEFEKTLKRANGELRNNSAELTKYSEALSTTAMTYGLSINEVALSQESFRKSGFEMTETLILADSAAKVAVATNEELGESTKALTAVVNSYSLGIDDVAIAEDHMNYILQNTNASMSEVNKLFEKNGALAESTGVGISELSIRYVELIEQGYGTRDAMTQVNMELMNGSLAVEDLDGKSQELAGTFGDVAIEAAANVDPMTKFWSITKDVALGVVNTTKAMIGLITKIPALGKLLNKLTSVFSWFSEKVKEGSSTLIDWNDQLNAEEEALKKSTEETNKNTEAKEKYIDTTKAQVTEQEKLVAIEAKRGKKTTASGKPSGTSDTGSKKQQLSDTKEMNQQLLAEEIAYQESKLMNQSLTNEQISINDEVFRIEQLTAWVNFYESQEGMELEAMRAKKQINDIVLANARDQADEEIKIEEDKQDSITSINDIALSASEDILKNLIRNGDAGLEAVAALALKEIAIRATSGESGALINAYESFSLGAKQLSSLKTAPLAPNSFAQGAKSLGYAAAIAAISGGVSGGSSSGSSSGGSSSGDYSSGETSEAIDTDLEVKEDEKEYRVVGMEPLLLALDKEARGKYNHSLIATQKGRR